MEIFESVKKKDRLWSKKYGWGVVQNVNSTNKCIAIKFLSRFFDAIFIDSCNPFPDLEKYFTIFYNFNGYRINIENYKEIIDRDQINKMQDLFFEENISEELCNEMH